MGIDQIRPETKRKNEQGGQWIKMKLGSEKRRFLALDEIVFPFMTIYHTHGHLKCGDGFFCQTISMKSNRWWLHNKETSFIVFLDLTKEILVQVSTCW